MKSLVDTNLSNSNNLSKLTKLLRRTNIPSVFTTLQAIQQTVNNYNVHHATLAESYRKLLLELRGSHNQQSLKLLKNLCLNQLKHTRRSKKLEVLTKEPQITRPSIYASQTGPSFTTHMPAGKGQDYHMPDGKMFKMTYDEADKFLQQLEKIKNVKLTKSEIVKVDVEEVKEAELVIKGRKEFLKNQEKLQSPQ
nr:hypothetical protein [Tanacetum cinerariifolium]